MPYVCKAEASTPDGYEQKVLYRFSELHGEAKNKVKKWLADEVYSVDSGYGYVEDEVSNIFRDSIFCVKFTDDSKLPFEVSLNVADMTDNGVYMIERVQMDVFKIMESIGEGKNWRDKAITNAVRVALLATIYDKMYVVSQECLKGRDCKLSLSDFLFPLSNDLVYNVCGLDIRNMSDFSIETDLTYIEHALFDKDGNVYFEDQYYATIEIEGEEQ